MSKQQKIHLFNCDQTYKLGAVEDWINTAKSKRELLLTTKNYFSLSQMTKLSSKTIPELDMDVAVFVVHAHESRLSINEEGAGIGYAMIYRALLQKTGGKVIIVIGGDDSYKDEDEEDKEFISRWARRKISSQFSEEFIDGRKSFIFSWYKKHREIHEKALLHFLDPNNKGEKFEYQPPAKPRKLPPKPATPPPIPSSEPEAFARPYSSLPAERPYTGERVQSNKPVIPVESRAHRISDQGARPKEKRSSSTETEAERLYTGERGQSTKPDVPEESRARRISDQGGKPKEKRSSSTETKDLVILGCSVLEGSMRAVMQEIKNIGPHLNLKKEPPVKNRLPAEIKQYLERNSLKYCVLVVDAESVQDAYENLPKRRDEYEDLLKTAVNKVAEKVIILVYDDLPLKPKDEAIVHQTIERIVKERDKGFVAWLKNGRLTVDSDVLAQIMKSESNTVQKMPQSGAEGFQGQTNIHFDATTESRQAANGDQTRGYQTIWPSESGDFQQHFQQPQCSRTIQQSYVSRKNTGPSSEEQVMLKSKLYYGNISYLPGDREIHPGFVVPAYVRDTLLQQYADLPKAEVKIVAEPENGHLRWIVYPKTKSVKGAAANEKLVLETRVCNGFVSMKKGDLVYICPGWEVPAYIAESLYRDYWAMPDAELCVFSDEKGQLRYKVDVGAGSRVVGFAKKTWKKL